MSTHEERPGRLFWISVAVGWSIAAFGIWTLFDRRGATKPLNVAGLFVGLALVNDLVLAPLLSAIALALGRRLSPGVLGVVLGALVVSGTLVLVSLPVLFGDRPADNPSLLPRNYPLGLAVALVLTWSVAVALVLLRRRSGR